MCIDVSQKLFLVGPVAADVEFKAVLDRFQRVKQAGQLAQVGIFSEQVFDKACQHTVDIGKKVSWKVCQQAATH